MNKLPVNYGLTNNTLVTDMYQLNMAYTLFCENEHEKLAVFNIFFKSIPDKGGYAVMAGLEEAVSFIENFSFKTDETRQTLSKLSCMYSQEFLTYLDNLKFTGKVTAALDGTPVFANEPILTVVAPIIQAQLLETGLLSLFNGSMLHALGARKSVEAAGENISVVDFGVRRANGLIDAVNSSKYAYIAGCLSTSNVYAANMMNIMPVGTIAHSYVTASENEYEAFVKFGKHTKGNITFLVDTYDTLKIGVPNAIKAFDYLKSMGRNLDNIGIRIDSGDLAYLSKKSRKMLDEAGYPNAKIVVSNGLRYDTIEALRNQKAPIDVIGVGDNIARPSTGGVSCVYKLVAIEDDSGNLRPVIKISEDVIKITNPGYTVVYRIFKDSKAVCDVIELEGKEVVANNLEVADIINPLLAKVLKKEGYSIQPLHEDIYIDGNLVYKLPSILESRQYCNCAMATIDEEIKRAVNPHKYYVNGTKSYIDFKINMIKNAQIN